MCSLYRCTRAHKHETCLHAEPVHTNVHINTRAHQHTCIELCTPVCAASHTSTHACPTQSHAHTRRACTHPHAQSCAQTPSHLRVCNSTHVYTSACPRAQCRAHQHTRTLCKAGRVHSHLGSPENTCTLPCTDTHVCTALCTSAPVCAQSRAHWHTRAQSHTHWHTRAQHSPRALLAPTPPRVPTHGAGAAAAHAGPSRRPGAGAGGTAPSRPASAPHRCSPVLPAVCRTAATTAAGCPPR